LPSSATTCPFGVFTSGLTSTRVASSAVKTSHSLTSTSITWCRTSAGKPAVSAISAALAASTPSIGSTGTRASASGRSTASCSISIPPSTEAIARYVRLARSSRYDT
jgi:hypothetical protein